MKKIFTIIICSLTLLSGNIQLFAQEADSNEEKAKRLIEKLWSFPYGGWNSMKGEFRSVGNILIEPLEKMLKKEETGEGAWRRIEWNHRKVAWALGDIGTEEATDKLIEMLSDTTINLWGRIGAISALGRNNSQKAIEPIILILNNKRNEPVFRREAAYFLGDIKYEKALPDLENALKENIQILTMGAIHGIGEIGNDESYDILFDALDYIAGYLRSTLYKYLIKLKPEEEINLLLMALEDKEWYVRNDAVKSLTESDKAVNDVLIKILMDNNSSDKAVWGVTVVLGIRKAEEAVEPLIKTLESKNSMIRNQAAVSLARINSIFAVELLIKELTNKNILIREEVCWILGEMRNNSAVLPLLDVIEDQYCGWIAVMALGKIASEQAVDPLIKLLKNKNQKLRWSAVWSLGKILPLKAVKPLINKLTDEDREIQLLAKHALIGIGDAKGLQAVEEYKKQNIK